MTDRHFLIDLGMQDQAFAYFLTWQMAGIILIEQNATIPVGNVQSITRT
jgi:hypothetical protein